MEEFLPLHLAGYAVVLSFITGRQLGHIGAKYARQKKESQIVFLILLILDLSYLAYIAYFYAG